MSSSFTPACLHISGMRSCAGSASRLAISVVTAAADLACARFSALYACSGLLFLSNDDIYAYLHRYAIILSLVWGKSVPPEGDFPSNIYSGSQLSLL